MGCIRPDTSHDGKNYALFRSEDLIHWNKVQDLSIAGEKECPDLFPLTDGDGNRKWIVIGAHGRYLVGDMREDGFYPTQEAQSLHYGKSAYAGQTFSGLPNGRIVKISDEELPTVTQLLFGQDLSLDDACELIRSSYPKIKLILITQGDKGAICYDCQSNKTYNCEAAPATVRSTVGAGDSYGATFLTWYFKTKDIMLSMTLASKVSAFVVSNQEAIPGGTKEFIKSIVTD